jgi:CHAT domain-containing protein/Tfp pilus assembly protein PilF
MYTLWCRHLISAVVALALVGGFVASSIAQTNKAELQSQFTALYEAGKYTEAIPLAQQVLAIDEASLGPNDPSVADSLNNLAVLYLHQGRYSDAEPLLKRALAIRKLAPRPDQAEIAGALNDLGAVYEHLGRYADAELLFKQSLAIYEKMFGENPDIAMALNDLASLYADEGHYTDAEALFSRALAIRRKAFGPNDVKVALSLNDLAELFRRQGRYTDAEPLLKSSLMIFEKTLGPDHPDVAPVLNNLGLIYAHQDRYADAEPIYRRALRILEKALGPDHPEVAISLDSLAVLYRDHGRYADAETDFNQALAIMTKVFGPDNPKIADLLNNKAGLYLYQRRYSDAEPLFKQSLAIDEKALMPNHPDVAKALNDLGLLYDLQGRYADAEPLFKRALAIYEEAYGPDHSAVAAVLNNIVSLYSDQRRYADALPLVRRTIKDKNAAVSVTLPVLFGAELGKLIPLDEALDSSLAVVQHAQHAAVAEALSAMAVRFAAGNDRLAQLVRKDQDLAGEAAALDKTIITAISQPQVQRSATAEQNIRDRIAAIAKERGELGGIFTHEFSDYAALSRPEPLTVEDIRPLLADDEALVIVNLDNQKSYVWAITRGSADWKELSLTAEQASKIIIALRGALEGRGTIAFDTQESFALYQEILAPVEDTFRAKPRLSFVLNGALTSLPLQLLVTRDPAGKALANVDWLVRTHAITVLPSVASLRVLRGKSAPPSAEKPLIGFANPVFDSDRLQQDPRVVADVAASRGIRGAVADIVELRDALPPLPETATELKEVAASVKADPTDVILGAAATETRVKRERLDRYRIIYFATHGLLAGEVAEFAKLNAEPALVLSLPQKATEFDDGLLTASEVAQLKLNADWVVLSACNTASGENPGAEALSGLARAFFYAGGRSLLVSNWRVESESAVVLMVGTFQALAADPKLSHAEALRKSMLAMIGDTQHPDWARPKYWAPFVVVGEPPKPTH